MPGTFGKTTILIDRALLPSFRAKVKALNNQRGVGERRISMLDIANQLVEMYVQGKVQVVFPEKRV